MYVVELKNGQLQNEPIRLHKEFYPTGCADIDVTYLRAWVTRFATGEYDINTGQQAPVAPAMPAAPDPALTPTQEVPTSTPSTTP